MKLPTLLHATRWIHLLQKDNWIYASRRRPDEPKRIDAVTIVTLHRNQPEDSGLLLVVLEEFRPAIDQCEFSFPAGLLNPGESILQGATRELKEETGLDVALVRHVSGETFTSAGLSDESQAYVMLESQGTLALNPGIDGERITVHLLTQQGCLDLLEKNRQGTAAISSRLWPVLMSVAYSGNFAGVRIAP